LHCPYEQNRSSAKDGEGAICLVLCVACDFTVSNGGKICEYCIGGKAWNDADVPQLEPGAKTRTPSQADAIKLVETSPFFASLYKQSLRSRLIGGDCPLYQGPNPVNVGDAFIKYRTASGDLGAQDLLAEMLDRQLQKAKSNVEGCDPVSVVKDKIATLAEDNGFVTSSEAKELRTL